ncbi:MAG: ATP-binding protein [Desulfuromonas sp.]|nr:ATP-binding protein [Desulfuromonas sp.]
MNTVRELGAMLAAFMVGSLTMVVLSYLQKTLLDLPQQQLDILIRTPTGYIIPVLAGGAVGMTIYLLYRRLKQLTHSTDTHAARGSATTATGQLLAYMLIAIIILCIFSTIQKSVNGYPMNLKGYILPCIVGSISGLFIGLLQLRIYRLLHQEQQERDRTLDILTSISDGLLVTDSTGQITLVNEMATQMLELSSEQLKGSTLAQALASATGDNSISDNQVNPVGSSNQFTIICSAGGLRSLKGTTSALRSSSPRSNALIMLLYDNTEEQHIDRMKSEFISSATHNLKTPITAITGYTELLLSEQEFSPEQTTEFLNYIYEKSWELDTLINNMIDINRAEAGRKISLNRDSTTTDALFNRVQHYCNRQETSCTFSCAEPECAYPLYIDQQKIAKVLENIIDNAIKFSPNGGRITITGSPAPDPHSGYYQVSISDEGIGMNPQQCQRIFDKFYRADSSDSGKKGIGLGLTLAKNLIEAHDGKIVATSKLGQGTTLSFYLPISDTAEHEN